MRGSGGWCVRRRIIFGFVLDFGVLGTPELGATIFAKNIVITGRPSPVPFFPFSKLVAWDASNSMTLVPKNFESIRDR